MMLPMASFPRPPGLQALRALVCATLAVSLGAALIAGLWSNALGLQQLFALTATAVSQGFLWQLVSYVFVQPLGHTSALSFLLSTAFSLCLLWVAGKMILTRKPLRDFFFLYFGSALVAGLAIFGLQTASGSPLPFAGNYPALYGLLMGWVMLFPDLQLLVFMLFPVRSKWLVLGLLGANLFVDLSSGLWISAAGSLAGALAGYLYGVLVWKAAGPFPSLRPLERWTARLLGQEASYHAHAKMYDFKTGRAILRDDEFLEAMLSKISQHGRQSLTWRERFRLRRLSKRRKNRGL
jgi:membrane associated rhomboid family serine protease